MQVRRNRSIAALRSRPDVGEMTVEVGEQVLSLEPVCVLMVNLAEDWIDLPALVAMTTDIYAPDGHGPEAEEYVRTKLLGLVTMGVLETRDGAL